MTDDIFIGLKEAPKNLTEILAQEGYALVEENKDYTLFTKKEGHWPIVWYLPIASKSEDQEDVPNWEKSGHKIVSELNINFPYGLGEEAYKLSDALAEKLNVVICDPSMKNEFY